MKNSLFRLVTLVMLALFGVACGSRPQVITGIQVQSTTVNNDLMLAMRADIDLGNMSFPAASFPILHPRGQTPIGSVQLNPLLGGRNEMLIQLNLSAMSDIELQTSSLPNGNAIPLIGNHPVIEVKLGAGARLYLAVAKDVAAIGVAIPISTFDSIGQQVGGVNLFPAFNVDKVRGAAGLFTSRQAGQNGFALVADVSAYMPKQDGAAPGLALASFGAPEMQDSLQLDYASQIPGKIQEDKINAMLLKLNRQGKRLQIR
jgi:hypothetical protein